MDFQEIEVLGIKFLFGRTIAPKNQLLMIKVDLDQGGSTKHKHLRVFRGMGSTEQHF